MPRVGSERPKGTRQLNVDVNGTILDKLRERMERDGKRKRQAVEEALIVWLEKTEEPQDDAGDE